MQTNQLVESSQIEIKYINNSEDFDNLKNGQKYTFMCSRCHKTHVSIKDYHLKRHKKQRELLCTFCMKIMNNNKNNLYLKKSTTLPIWVESSEDLKYISNRSKIMYKCKNCGKQSQVILKAERRDRISKLLCCGCNKALTCQERFGLKHNPTRNIKFKDIYFDSKWELAFYLFYLDKGCTIIREPKSFIFEFNGVVHNYVPDFEVDGRLYEIKGDHFFKDDGTMCNPFDHSQDELFEAKHQCGILNGVTFIRSKEIVEYLTYAKATYPSIFDGK